MFSGNVYGPLFVSSTPTPIFIQGVPKKMGLAIIAISPKPFNLGQQFFVSKEVRGISRSGEIFKNLSF